MATNSPSAKEIFFQAIEIESAAERAAFLEQATGGDTAKKAEIEGLLQAHNAAGNFLGGSPQTTDQPPRTGPGLRIGRYRLLEQIGEGGMGTVWVAEQSEPVKRRVALKLIKPGMDSRQVLSRFEAERQALALMDHPNIAKVFDGGMTDEGRPYFVMEYVKGVPITEYCDSARLSIQQRLKLFAQVCQAVQHAHQKGIIHRDLKPSNILVCLYDGQPVPKLLDFGLAKAMHQPLTEHTLYTAHGLMVGTPLYMSPEQAEFNNLDVDTRTDIYSLGVILYELLTGTTPLEKQQFKDAAFQEILRLIKEVEPPRPSLKISSLSSRQTPSAVAGNDGTRSVPTTSLASIAAQRSLEPAQLSRAVRGDLDWIVMKSLEKERSRRYETANGLSRDIDRYLCDEPVEACPPRTSYRLGKFLRRNKGPVLAAAVVLLTLISGIIGTTWGLIRAETARQAEAQQRKLAEESRQAESQQRKLADAAEETARANERQAAAERDRAEQEKRIAQAVKEFLQNRLLRQASAASQAEALDRSGGKLADIKENPTIRELLDRASTELTPERIETQFPKLPLVQAEILKTIGDTYYSVGEYDRSIAHLERSRDLFTGELGPDHPDTLSALHNLAYSYEYAWRMPEAIGTFEHVRDRQTAMLGPDHPSTLTTLNNLADAYGHAGRLQESIQLFERVRDRRIATLGPDHPDTLTTLSGLAYFYNEVGRREEFFQLRRQVREKRLATLRPDHPEYLAALASEAEEHLVAGRYPEAIRLLEGLRDKRIATLGPDHPTTLSTLNSVARAYLFSGNFSEASKRFEEVHPKFIEKLGPDHRHSLVVLTNLAMAYQRSGRVSEAIPLIEQAHERIRAKLGPDHQDTKDALNQLHSAYNAAGRSAEAIELFERQRDDQIARLGADHPNTLAILNRLAQAYWNANRNLEAAATFEQVHQRRRAKLGPDHPDTLESVNGLAWAYQRLKKTQEAIQLFEKVRSGRIALSGPNHASLVSTLNGLAFSYEAEGQLAQAVETRKQHLNIQRQLYTAGDRRLIFGLEELGKLLLKTDQFEKAETILSECLAIRDQAQPDDWQTFNAKSLLGHSLAGQNKHADAEPLLLTAYERMKEREAKIPASVRAARLTEALQRLIDLYTAWDKPDQAAKWQQELAGHQAANTAKATKQQ